ncbi:MAG: rhodanese-like domain-containing protein [Proteobacteria bacterium]|nr:rhodanese-like domain-containing protein [Pseudomonadota bacterium]
MDHFLDYLQNHIFLAGLAVAAVTAVLVYELRMRATQFAAVSSQEAIRLMNQGAVVLDLRDKAAHDAGRISGSRLLTADQLASAGESLKKLKNKTLVVYCDRGVRSAAAVRQLREQGFLQSFSLSGGVAGWQAESLPLQRG